MKGATSRGSLTSNSWHQIAGGREGARVNNHFIVLSLFPDRQVRKPKNTCSYLPSDCAEGTFCMFTLNQVFLQPWWLWVLILKPNRLHGITWGIVSTSCISPLHTHAHTPPALSDMTWAAPCGKCQGFLVPVHPCTHTHMVGCACRWQFMMLALTWASSPVVAGL